jgi:hypothetical protein
VTWVGDQFGAGFTEGGATRSELPAPGRWTGSRCWVSRSAHFSWGGKNYNGFAASDTSSTGGARSLSMHHAHAGIITRGVLLDIAAIHGVPWLDPGHPITPAELVAAEQRQAVTASPGTHC